MSASEVMLETSLTAPAHDGFNDVPLQSVPELPEDIFLLILGYLDLWDMVRCRKVAKSWRSGFSNPRYLQIKLKEYPRAYEMRQVQARDHTPTTAVDWKSNFDKIASRYHHLNNGKARSIQKYKMEALEQFGQWYPVAQWDYHESQPGGRLYYENATHISRLGGKPYLFRPTFWTYDDGLLVFAPSMTSGARSKSSPGSEAAPRNLLVVVDIETGTQSIVPFNTNGKILRNIRLTERTLVVEWAEKEPFHDLNDSEKVHRHFATCFDVVSASTEDAPSRTWPPRLHYSSNPCPWKAVFRCEWKLHFLGLPLNHRDRFFSTHTAHHYAVYFWQPNRSMYTGNEDLPIESLTVWDIHEPSPYLPSTDPTGHNRPKDTYPSGPHAVSRLSFHALSFIGIRQHSTISLLTFHIHSPSTTLVWRENTWAAGQGYFDPAERLWRARTTSFPFLGTTGPACVSEWDATLPPYRGHTSMDSAELAGGEGENWFLPVLDVLDQPAGIRFSLVETCFGGETLGGNRLVVRVRVDGEGEGEEVGEGEWVALRDELVDEVACMGRIAGGERWIVGHGREMEIVVLKF